MGASYSVIVDCPTTTALRAPTGRALSHCVLRDRPMTVGGSGFKAAMRMWASGVTVVTAADAGERHGMTVSSFASVSLVPELISVCLAQDARTLSLVEKSGRFGVSLLAAEQQPVSDLFATSGTETDQFESQRIQLDESSLPLISEALATLSCEVHSVIPVGDHSLVVGHVRRTRVREGLPLVYFDAAYRALTS